MAEQKTPLAIGRKHGGPPVTLHQQNIVGVAPATVGRAIHAWRTDGHAGYRKAERRRLFFQQTPDFPGRHMPFEQVAADLGGMTGSKRSGMPKRGGQRRDPGLHAYARQSHCFPDVIQSLQQPQ
jgi:hypothetical protein